MREEMMKKIISLLIALSMVLYSVTVAFAVDESQTTADSGLEGWEHDKSEYSTAFPEYYHNPAFDNVVRYDGIDVSIFNGDINWKKVKADGIDFAIIRIGGRFYGSGGLYSDELFEQNYKGAKAAGIKVGIYFYSQALNESEAKEEVEYIMELLDGKKLDLPIYMDYECPKDARISNMTKAQGTKNVKAFCKAVESNGYDAGFYSYLAFVNKYINASEISDLYPVWMAQYYKNCDYKYDYDMWQYTSSGKVDGIDTRVDMNYWYDKNTLRKDLSKTTTTIEYIKTEYDGSAKTPKVTVNGLTKDKDYYLSYSNNTEPGTATVTIKGKKAYRGTITKTFKIIENMTGTDRVFSKENELRIYGSDRYETAFEVADTLKVHNNISKFDSVIVASGTGYADALAASYLAEKKDAPILLVKKEASTENRVREYIKANVKSGGSVYIIGGPASVSDGFASSLTGYTVKRLAGDDRYETNLAILNEGGRASNGLIISSGTGYADSLSASATGMPILLVNGTLSEAQAEYISNAGGKVYIAGGTAAVSEELEAQIKEIKSGVTRLAGATRYETSYKIATTFFGGARQAAIVAYAVDYPDGLVASALGQAMGSPVILVDGSHTSYAKQYAKSSGIESVAGIIGPKFLSDSAFTSII